MRIDGREFDTRTGAPERWDDVIFSCSAFRGLHLEGPGVDGALIHCALEGVDWYWGLFNAAVVARTSFEGCVFRGCSFRGVDFVECAFTRCRFVLDNLGGACVFDNCRLVECAFDDCEIALEKRPGRAPTFSRSRFYGCRQSRSRGFEAAF